MSRHNDCQLHQSQPTTPGLPPYRKGGRSFTTTLDVTEDINLSPVTPIICIQVPVEVLGRRNIGPSTHLHLCLNLLFIMFYSPKTDLHLSLDSTESMTNECSENLHDNISNIMKTSLPVYKPL